MSAREDLFKNALIELAKEGNEKAKFVLTLAEVGFNHEFNIKEIIDSLKEANNFLSEALYKGALEYSNDRDLINAMKGIDNALGLLALRHTAPLI